MPHYTTLQHITSPLHCTTPHHPTFHHTALHLTNESVESCVNFIQLNDP